jgi:hypothetical protein
LRFWETDVLTDLHPIADRVEEVISRRKNNSRPTSIRG